MNFLSFSKNKNIFFNYFFLSFNSLPISFYFPNFRILPAKFKKSNALGPLCYQYLLHHKIPHPSVQNKKDALSCCNFLATSAWDAGFLLPMLLLLLLLFVVLFLLSRQTTCCRFFEGYLVQ